MTGDTEKITVVMTVIKYNKTR